jgi:D-arabinose 1-dehydrogenase-like Zn-dependent alcohol dehydrogenase
MTAVCRPVRRRLTATSCSASSCIYHSAMGCETWAISTTASKEAEARKFGATHFLVSTVRGEPPHGERETRARERK